MLIEFDLDEVKASKIPVNQTILLKFIADKEERFPYMDVCPFTEEDINQLKAKDILMEESRFKKSDISELYIKEGALKEVKPVDFFDEFYSLYPISVARTDGIKDYLRGDVSRCRKAYGKLVGKSKSKHKYFMDCLRFEISHRVSTNKMGYMKRMSKWFAAEEWLLYEEFIKDKKGKKPEEKVYGTAVE